MRVVITGSSGLIGQALGRALRADGHEVVPLVRHPPGPGEVRWDPPAGTVDAAGLEGADAVVHLAGAGIADRRWTEARKAEILDSRVRATTVLADALATLERPPPVLVSGSAVGWYGGDHGDEELTEDSDPGADFLAGVCAAWEDATAPAQVAGIRVVRLRSGIVLSRHGGALGRQLPIFRLGLGGRLGSGRQWVSWITIDDEVGAIRRAIDDDTLQGPVNATAPAPVTNAAFTAALGRALHRPAVLAVPGPVLGLALGRQLADEALLGGQRVLPARLTAAGYRFAHPTIDAGLAAVLADPG